MPSWDEGVDLIPSSDGRELTSGFVMVNKRRRAGGKKRR
jgi:hypothetical protein